MNVLFPAHLIFANIMPQSGDYSTIVLFDLPITLGVISCYRQVFHGADGTQRCEQPARGLNSLVH